MSNSFKNSCFLLQTFCLKASYLGELSLALEEVKLVSGENLEIRVPGTDNNRKNQSIRKCLGAEGAGCSGGTWQMGLHHGGHIWEESLTTKGPFSQGLVGLPLRPCFSVHLKGDA